jgi:hypothetical protein
MGFFTAALAGTVFNGLLQFGKGLVSPITTYLGRRQEIQSAEQTAKLAVISFKVQAYENRLTNAQAGDIKWENTSIENSGWKDEYWTLVISIPAILCFCGPRASQIVTDGFLALQGCPEWYKWCMLISVSSAYGYKKLADFMALKKGS